MCKQEKEKLKEQEENISALSKEEKEFIKEKDTYCAREKLKVLSRYGFALWQNTYLSKLLGFDYWAKHNPARRFHFSQWYKPNPETRFHSD